MTFDIKVQTTAATSSHKLELRSAEDNRVGSGGTQFLLDTEPPSSVDWVEVTPGVYSIVLDGRSYEAQVSSSATAERGAMQYEILIGARRFVVEVRDPRARRHTTSTGGTRGPKDIVAPMPGKIVKVLTSEGQAVEAGQGLLVIEAMKMQNELQSPRKGSVERIYVSEGVGVEAGVKLLRLA